MNTRVKLNNFSFFDVFIHALIASMQLPFHDALKTLLQQLQPSIVKYENSKINTCTAAVTSCYVVCHAKKSNIVGWR